MSKPTSLDQEIAGLRDRVAALTALADSAPFSPTARRKVDHELRIVIETLEAALRRLDPLPLALRGADEAALCGTGAG